jgi:ATP adenylyltransferase
MTAKHENEVESCPFCHPDREIIARNEHALAIADLYPVSLGHSLILPKMHRETVFDLPAAFYVGCFNLVRDVKDALETKHHPNGFNVGVNCGIYAGQTVMHAHIHIIPRYKGDVPKPRGGIRHIIPGKGDY